MAQDLHSVVNEIITAHELRIREIGDKLKEKGAQLIDYFRSERANLTQALESILAKKAHLRRKDFRLMMQDIESYQMDREANLKRLIDGMKEGECQRLQLLKESLAMNPSPSAVDIITNTGKEKLIEEELIEFERAKDELSLQLNRLLEKANSLRIKDFKKALKKLKMKKEEAESNELVRNLVSKQEELQKEVMELLNNFRAFQPSIGKLWQKEVTRDGNGR